MTDFNSKRTWGPTPNYPKVLAYKRPKEHREMIVLAGPCSVESPEQMRKIIPTLKKNRVTYARGGVYRAGTYPRDVFGLQAELASEWVAACHVAGLKVVMECLDVRQLAAMDATADAIQVGARHMQDYALLKECAQLNKTVFLKRHPGSTLDEFLGAAEYLARGRCKPVLIERGSSTHMNHVRWDLSVSTIAAVKEICDVPIIVDASHGSGRRDLVRPLLLAGMAAGADGFLVEVHPNPEASLSDADQALPLKELSGLVRRAVDIRNVAAGWCECYV